MGISVSRGYFHGYYNGTQYPFYFDGYKKTETYTKTEIDKKFSDLQNIYVRNGNSSKPFTLTYTNENSSITMPTGKAIYANVLGINVPLSGGGTNGSLSQNGYAVFPNGFIIQWGKFSAWYDEGTPYNINFPKTFPHQCFNVLHSMTSRGSGSGADGGFVYNISKSGFTFVGNYDDDPDSVTTSWIAIGY